MKLHVICAAYQRAIPLRILVDSFVVQTNPNWELHVIHDGQAPEDVLEIMKMYPEEKRVTFYQTPERNGFWGMPNRKFMLQRMYGDPDDFVLITNDDNYYVPLFVEYMLKEVKPGVGIVYCNTVHSGFHYVVHPSSLREGYIDMGAFIVRLNIAQKVGFNHQHETADGAYAEECAKYCAANGFRTVHIPKPIWVHN